MSDPTIAIGYVQIDPIRYSAGGKAYGAKVVGMTQGRPTNLKGERKAIKVIFRIPLSLFDLPSAEVTIDIPEDPKILITSDGTNAAE